MSSLKLKICAAVLAVSFAATAALANQSGSLLGPMTQGMSQAQAMAVAQANARCVGYGGLQSYSFGGFYPGPPGYYAVYITYVCNA